MVSKGRLRLTQKSKYYDSYNGLWFDIEDILDDGSLVAKYIYENDDSVTIVIRSNEDYELYEHYIRGFRTKYSNDNYRPIFQDQFEELLNERIALIKTSLITKGKEYASNGRKDRMHNFITAANRIGESPEKALDGMLAKHLISYQDTISDLEKGIVPTKHYITEKYGDIINYFILSEMLISNRIK